jgi:putative nucleotidyltransferase with HDIG domain
MCELASGIVLHAFRNGEPVYLLLENRLHGTWGFPKGHLEEGEDPETGARRECLEETGIAVETLEPGFMKTTEHTYSLPGSAETLRKRTYYFLASCEEQEIRISEEHGRFFWEARLDARERLKFDNLRDVLDCAFGATGRSQDVQTARTLLDRVSSSDELWRRHCIEVARVARRIADGVVNARPDLPVDPVTVEASALVHDIGRSRDQGVGHPEAGMDLLMEHGCKHLAKPCISHWLKGRSHASLSRDPFFSMERLEKLWRIFDLDVFTCSEKIISVADSLVQHDVLVRLDERYREARERYGDSRWMRDNEEITETLIKELEGYLGESLYHFLHLD